MNGMNFRKDNHQKTGFKKWCRKPVHGLREVWLRIVWCYEAPVVRFYYHAVSVVHSLTLLQLAGHCQFILYLDILRCISDSIQLCSSR